MNQIEKTILDCAKHHLDCLRGYVGLSDTESAKDVDEAVASFQRVSALAELAQISDSGLSSSAADELQSIYRYAAAALAFMRESNQQN